MTENFKSNILKYLTNKFEIQDKSIGTQIPFTQTDTITSNIDAELTARFPNGYSISFGRVSNTLKSNNETNVMWGNYTDTDNVEKGFILLLLNGKILQIITEYDTGVKIGYIYKLAVDEDSNFYGIIKGNDFTTPYLTLLNNFTVKRSIDTEYIVKRRISYNVNITFSEDYDYLTMLTKAPSSSYYLIGNPEFLHMIKTEVGGNNKEANFYIQSQSIGDITLSNISADDESATIELKKLQNGIFYIYKATYTDSNSSNIQLVKQTELNIDTNFTSTNTGSLEQKGNNTYVINVVNKKTFPEKEYVLSIYRIKNNVEVEYLIGFFQEDYPGASIIWGRMFNTGSTIALAISIPRGTTINYSNSIGLINEEDDSTPFVYTQDEISTSSSPFDFRIVSFKNDFNLLNANLYTNTQTLIYKTIYNPNNYNGIEYNSDETMVPQYVNIFNSNNVVIFSRNLYNKTINNNITTSTIEIPNFYLNNVTLAKQDLISKTNNILNENTENLTKNIYESLYLNFINTITIKDTNDPNNEIERTEGAIALNQEISNKLLSTSIANKYKKVYRLKDEVIKVFDDSEIQIMTNDLVMYEFNVFADDDIQRIDIISNDENNVYATINGASLEVGKLYKISQYVEIN